jgi:hypothetical protein
VRTGPDACKPKFRRSRLSATDANATYEDGADHVIGSSVLRPSDTSAVFHAYGPERIHPGSDFGSAGDRVGAATASADFDGDGVQDLAIAAPGAGKVFVFKGVYASDDSGRIEHRTRLALDASGATALAVGDFDRDGFDDLVVGRAEATPFSSVRIYSRLDRRASAETSPSYGHHRTPS